MQLGQEQVGVVVFARLSSGILRLHIIPHCHISV